MSGPTIGSLFSGYGGIDLGLKNIWPEARTAWVSDIEPGPCKVLTHRYPDAPNLGDITKIDWSQVEPVDIITGGSPCQDLSHAGKRAGMRPGTRSGLWASMLEGITTLRPSLVIWENVGGAYSAAADSEVEPCPGCMGNPEHEPPLRALARVLGDLAAIGYDTAWVGLRAADVGACHGRLRVFVLAWPADAEGDRGTLTLPTPRATCGGSSTETVAMLPTPTAMDAKASGGSTPSDVTLTDATVRNAEVFGQYAPAIARHEAAFGRPAPAPVEPTGKNGANRLSPRFTEWMMMLPDGWVTDVPGITRSDALRLCGNGVVPMQAEVAVRHLLGVAATAQATPATCDGCECTHPACTGVTDYDDLCHCGQPTRFCACDDQYERRVGNA